MNLSLYQQLLDDAEKDLAAFDDNLDELQTVERYAERKLNGGGDSKFRDLLEEVRRDMAGAERDATELRNVADFARKKLGGGGADVPHSDRRSRGGSSEDEPRRPPVAAKPAAPQAARPSAPPAPAPKPAPLPTKPVPRPAAAEEPDTMQTIEFGPDGFPMR